MPPYGGRGVVTDRMESIIKLRDLDLESHDSKYEQVWRNIQGMYARESQILTSDIYESHRQTMFGESHGVKQRYD